MSQAVNQNKKSRLKRWEERKERSKLTREALDKQIQDVQSLKEVLDKEDTPIPKFTKFGELPISERTILGLERGNFKKMTPIQAEAIPLALAGHDVLGAAKTGSGKTLAFLIPAVERLLLERWDGEIGVGTLILSPTRELALQIFKVLQVVGYKHVLSAALLTGGHDVNEEKKRLHKISIIVATPGRLVQHLKEGSDLSLDNLQVLVMDETDRLLDMGFREDIMTILEYVPESRQTLLFSATQTTDIQMLAQLSLKNPSYVSAHASSITPTPLRMCQNFIIVDLHRKLDALLIFIKRHPNDKTVVFTSTCNQVKYMYLAFSKILKKLRIPSMCLTGKMKQFRREEVFTTYCRCKSAILFCTDIAARGLDFPMIHYVIQFDCPDSAQTYIHRAGRTARAGARGVSILFLTPSETPMLSYLASKKIPLREIAIKGQYLNDSHELFVAVVVQGLKYEAQKAFIAYLRSVFFAANKAVFNIKSINCEKFATSLGLLVVPNMSELGNLQRSAKNLPWDVVNYIRQKEEGKVNSNKRSPLTNDAAGKEDDKEVDDEENEAAALTETGVLMTRKERHLKASDMFRQMKQREKYAPGKNSHSALSRLAALDEEGDILVKKPKSVEKTATSGGDQKGNDENSQQNKKLTFDERMQGIARNKKRKIIETVDLRIRDLNLSKRTTFKDDEDERSPQRRTENAEKEVLEDENQKTILQKLEGMSKQTRRRFAAEDEEHLGDSDLDSEVNEDAFVSKMTENIRRHREDDKLRAKQLRKDKKLKKEGKLIKNTDGDGSDEEGDMGAFLGSNNDESESDKDDQVTKNLLLQASVLKAEKRSREKETEEGEHSKEGGKAKGNWKTKSKSGGKQMSHFETSKKKTER